jgi:hypothetical protein
MKDRAAKMKRRIFKGIVSGVLIITIICVIYVVSGTTAKKNDLLSYLENRGYSHSDIQSIKITHSFANIILGYQEWGGCVIFEDEPTITYQYGFISGSGEISQGSFSGDDGSKDKDELLDSLKHLER